MGRDMAMQLIDRDGELKSFQQFRTDVQGIASHHVDSWLRTEYDTAIKRSHRAVEMRKFISEADVLPNIEWLPSMAVNPRESHMPFYHRIWPIGHPFWATHKPGDEWGCLCGWAATAEEPTDNTDLGGESIKPSPGLGGNPAQTAQIFSDDHPYFPSNCTSCPFKTVQFSLFTNKTKDCYHCKNILRAIEKTEQKLEKERELLQKKKAQVTARIGKKKLISPVILTSGEIKHGTVVCSKSDIRQLVYHAGDVESLRVAMEMDMHLGELHFIRTEIPKHATVKKQRRGLQEYTVYEVTIGDEVFVVKCEARINRQTENVYEHPYSIYKK